MTLLLSSPAFSAHFTPDSRLIIRIGDNEPVLVPSDTVCSKAIQQTISLLSAYALKRAHISHLTSFVDTDGSSDSVAPTSKQQYIARKAGQ